MVRLIDSLDMTIAVDLYVKPPIQQTMIIMQQKWQTVDDKREGLLFAI